MCDNKFCAIIGYDIEKGTMILFNTYHLNVSEEYWEEPVRFNPSRFLSGKEPDVQRADVHIMKPDHFFPFSSGRRACLGYKMVKTIAFVVIANLVLNFKMFPINDTERKKMENQLEPTGCLALPPDGCFKVALSSRVE